MHVWLCIRIFVIIAPLRMKPSHRPPFLRSLTQIAVGLLGLFALPHAQALTSASLAAANLPGKTLTFSIAGGTAPFETSGTFDLVFGTNGTYTMPVSSGNAAFHSGTYTVTPDAFGVVFKLDGYIVNNSVVQIAVIPTNDNLRSQFETYTIGANKNGTVVFSTGGTGGGGSAPVVTSATTATATVGTPFSYQITTSPAATAFTNAGGNAPVAINPTTGLVTGSFSTVGTTTFSFTANNAAGSSPVTTVTVTASAASGGGTTPPGTPDGTRYAGRYLGKVGSRVGTAVSTNTEDYEVFVNANGTVVVNIGALPGALTGTIAASGIVTFTGGAYIPLYGITTALVEGTRFSSSYGTLQGTTQYRFELSTTFVPAQIVAAPDVSALAGTYSGQQFSGVPGPNATILLGDFVATVTAGGVLSAQGGTITGRVAANGTVTFDTGGSNIVFGYTTGQIANGRLTATGQITQGGTLLATYRVDAPRTTATTTTVSAVTAPSNLVGYRNRVGQTFEFTVTGGAGSAIWGTDVYTDDSSIARAAVHAGVLAVGQTKVVTVTILPGQSSYPASTRNGVTSASWGAWSGSYSFAGAGAVVGATVATAKPTLATGFVAATPTLSAGTRLVLPIALSGGGNYTYQWYLNDKAIAGATANPYVIDSVGAANAGTYTVDATNALGTTRLTAGSVTITSVGAPVIALNPLSKTITPGGTFTMATNASGTGNTYQWFRNGTSLAGETGAILLRQNVNAADAGTYTVRITNSAGTATSTGGTVTLSPTASRPANISVRASVAAGQSIIPGFFVQGTGTKRVIVRAVGPGLAQFNVGGTMSDPKLEVFRGSTKIAESDNWDGTAATTAAFAGVGAFGLTTGSRDAALVIDLAAGQSYTAVVSGVGNASGVVLVEVYDADTIATMTSRLVNVSVRGQAGTGDATLILGLVIGGDGQRTLLVRGIGPRLAAFGVANPLADPRLQIFDAAQRAVLANDNWGQADFVGELVQASSYVNAFSLEPGSKDAATLSLLDPGAYTIQVSGAGTTTGEALVEVYEVP
jgi:hypothetical protein